MGGSDQKLGRAGWMTSVLALAIACSSSQTNPGANNGTGGAHGGGAGGTPGGAGGKTGGTGGTIGGGAGGILPSMRRSSRRFLSCFGGELGASCGSDNECLSLLCRPDKQQQNRCSAMCDNAHPCPSGYGCKPAANCSTPGCGTCAPN